MARIELNGTIDGFEVGDKYTYIHLAGTPENQNFLLEFDQQHESRLFSMFQVAALHGMKLKVVAEDFDFTHGNGTVERRWRPVRARWHI
ncbi:hypothetical protein V7x_54280 [Crateriforma conspicua]|uniref:Uncharacterized protein n=1 Tax=Crateriforma conspicua TaxID=2527996 RepID=A0A5C6FHS3_9PLAN|nr:hypothetical protein [Crateriforma conspicua]TWU61116.1 hypothetical protein V7x_54280 [Crateriforma conspicua]